MIEKALTAHLLSLILFAFIYYSLPYGTFGFNDDSKIPNFFDFFNLSTTIQAGVGLTNMVAKNDIGLFITTVQQIMMLFKNVFILYYFSRI